MRLASMGSGGTSGSGAGSQGPVGLAPTLVTMAAAPSEAEGAEYLGWGGRTVQPDVELVLPAVPENVSVVRHVFAGVGDVLGMDSSSLGRLRLALSEACTNVVVHAYEAGNQGTLEVDAFVDDRLLNVVVRDHGAGVRPRPDSPGLGMGLPLIAAVTDEVEIVGNERLGNEVRMTFLLPAPDAVAPAEGT